MISGKRIVDVAGQQATAVAERYPRYRQDLVRCLVTIVSTQSEGLSDRGRRDQVGKVIDAFGSKVAAERKVGA
jgi:hypothetical protein